MELSGDTVAGFCRQGAHILCAAIWVDTGEAIPSRRSYAYPLTGLLFTGWRHGDCFTTLNTWAP